MRSIRSAWGLAFFLAVVAVVFVGSAQAQTRGGVENPVTDEPCPGSADLSACLGMSDVSGNYYACSAKGSWGNTCVAWLENWDDKAKVWKGACTRVNYSASCQCDSVKKTTSGKCTYQP